MTQEEFEKLAWEILPSETEVERDLIYELVKSYKKLGIERWNTDVTKTFLCGFMVGCSIFSELITNVFGEHLKTKDK